MAGFLALAAPIFWNVVTGVIGDQVKQEIVNKLISKNLKKWLDKTDRPVNHDIERAIRKAELNATLIFLKEYIEKHTEKKSFLNTTPENLKGIKNYLKEEKLKLNEPLYVPSPQIIDVNIEDLLNPSSHSTIKQRFKDSILLELEENLKSIPKEFKQTLIEGIEIENNKVDWYDLVSSFFIESVKTNERVKSAINNELFVGLKEDFKQQNLVINLSFANLSQQISASNQSIISKIDGIDTKLDDFLEKLALIFNENSNSNLSPEIVKQKSEIKTKIKDLKRFVNILQKEDNSISNIVTDSLTPFEDIDFEDIINALKNETCVLFIGPEISTDENGNSLHETYFRSISNDRIKYNLNDSFFLPGSENKIINKAKQYYSNDFLKQNKKGNAILEKLAQIPFKLIVSYAPDDSLSRIYKKNNIGHESYEYKADTETLVERADGSKEPIIYNAFGNAAKNGKYIYSHKQFNEFSKAEPQKRIPIKIESELAEGTSYLFIGFDFNKWYFRAMMFDLNIMDYAERMVLDAKNKTETFNKDFIKKQFDVSFIDADYDILATILLKKSKEAGLSKSLNSHFSNSILKELESVRLNATDTDKLEVLSKLFSNLDIIEKKIIENKE